MRGVRRQEAGDLAGAVADFGQVIRLAPSGPLGLLLRGRALRLRGETGKAMEDLSRCRTVAAAGWEYAPELAAQIAAARAAAGPK